VRSKLAEMGITQDDVKDAISWVRKKTMKTPRVVHDTNSMEFAAWLEKRE
jgi:hypothetical protein